MDNNDLWIVQFSPAQGVPHVAPPKSVVERNAVELMEIGKPGPESAQWVTIAVAFGYERAHLLAHDFRMLWRARWAHKGATRTG